MGCKGLLILAMTIALIGAVGKSNIILYNWPIFPIILALKWSKERRARATFLLERNRKILQKKDSWSNDKGTHSESLSLLWGECISHTGNSLTKYHYGNVWCSFVISLNMCKQPPPPSLLFMPSMYIRFQPFGRWWIYRGDISESYENRPLVLFDKLDNQGLIFSPIDLNDKLDNPLHDVDPDIQFYNKHYTGSLQSCDYYLQMFNDKIKKCKISSQSFSRHWPVVRGIHRPPVNSPHKGQWRGALMISLIWAWMNKRLNKQSWCWWYETSSRSL